MRIKGKQRRMRVKVMNVCGMMAAITITQRNVTSYNFTIIIVLVFKFDFSVYIIQIYKLRSGIV